MAGPSIVHRAGPRRTPACPEMHELKRQPAHPMAAVERWQYNAGTTVFAPFKEDTSHFGAPRGRAAPIMWQRYGCRTELSSAARIRTWTGGTRRWLRCGRLVACDVAWRADACRIVPDADSCPSVARRRATGRDRPRRRTPFPRSSTRFARSESCPFLAATPMQRDPRRSCGRSSGSALCCDRQRHRRRVREFAVSGPDGPLHPRRRRAGICGPAGVARRGAAGAPLDNHNTPLFFAAVREANAALPAERSSRVLLGDPPIDWEHVRSGPISASGRSSATPIRPTSSGGSCWRTTGAR